MGGKANLRNVVVRQTENSVEFTKRKRQSRLLGRLTKQLILNLQIPNLERIPADETLDGSRTILNRESGSILLVRRRSLGVVLCVQETCDAGAACAGDPEV